MINYKFGSWHQEEENPDSIIGDNCIIKSGFTNIIREKVQNGKRAYTISKELSISDIEVVGGNTVKIIGEAKGYIIHETCNGKYILCKILKEYGTGLEAKEQCKNDLVALVCHKTTEKKLIKENHMMKWAK